MKEYHGGCLCSNISYVAKGEPMFPHLCSCTMCQKWSGALTVAWVDFPLRSFAWNGKGGEPSFYRSSEKTQRGFCPKCGAALCALDDGDDKICITIASLQEPNLIIPGKQHSYHKSAPRWWKVAIKNQ